MHRFRRLLAVVSALCLSVGIGWTHEGHDEGAPAPAASDPNLVVHAVTSPAYEVVIKYLSTPSEQPAHARLYISDFATNAPIERAGVEVRGSTPGPFTVTATSVSPGVYAVDLPYTRPGDYVLLVAVKGPTAGEFAMSNMPLGRTLEPASVATSAVRNRPHWALWVGLALVLLVGGFSLVRRRSARLAARTVQAILVLMTLDGLAFGPAEAQEGHDRRYVPKESQFLLGVRTSPARYELLHEQISSVGHVVPQSGGVGTVAAPQAGRVEGIGRPLAVGDRVRKGQILGYLLVIDRLPIRAPIAGLVSDVGFTPGQWVQGGQTLARILDESKVRVEVPLFGENLTRALRARSAHVSLPALRDRMFPARVLGLAPTASTPEGSGSSEQPSAAPIAPVLLAVQNVGGHLRPGMLVEVSIEGALATNLLTVPQSAIVYQESGPGVFVHTGPEIFEYRPVALASRFTDKVAIRGEVKPGDRVVSAGAYTLVSAPTIPAAAPETKR